MTGYEAYVLFLAIKRHFTTKDYDAFRYNFKIRTSVAAYEKRNDRYFFEKLAKHEDPKGYTVSACVSDSKAQGLFIGSLIRDTKYALFYKKWVARKESIEYNFESEFSALQVSDLRVLKGQAYPKIVDCYFQNTISLETLVILQREFKVLDTWDRKIQDTIIWPDISMKIRKYAPFVSYDKEKIRKILQEFAEGI